MAMWANPHLEAQAAYLRYLGSLAGSQVVEGGGSFAVRTHGPYGRAKSVEGRGLLAKPADEPTRTLGGAPVGCDY
jgi:hypothetical protein